MEEKESLPLEEELKKLRARIEQHDKVLEYHERQINAAWKQIDKNAENFSKCYNPVIWRD